jgi:SAM-dependent methyltransferase
LHEHLARTAGELIGLDLDVVGVEDARQRGYEAHAVDCRDVDAVRALGLPPADLVVAGEVIEHLDDPGSFLDGLHALVAPSGLLVVTTPNASGLVNTAALLGNLEVNHPDHVVLYSCTTLDTMLTRHGWQPVEHAVFLQQVKSLGAARSTGGAGRPGLVASSEQPGVAFPRDGGLRPRPPLCRARTQHRGVAQRR